MATFIAKDPGSQGGACPCFLTTDDGTGDLVVAGTLLDPTDLAVFAAEAAANDSALAPNEGMVRLPEALVSEIVAAYVSGRLAAST